MICQQYLIATLNGWEEQMYKNLSEHKEYVKQYDATHKEERSVRDKERYKRIRMEKIAQSKARYEAKKENIKKQVTDRYKAKKEQICLYTRMWKKANRWRANHSQLLRRVAVLSATPSWANSNHISLFYRVAAEQTELYGESFHVDHIVPLQGKTVCGLHVEDNLQIIKATENISKKNKLIQEDIYD